MCCNYAAAKLSAIQSRYDVTREYTEGTPGIPQPRSDPKLVTPTSLYLSSSSTIRGPPPEEVN